MKKDKLKFILLTTPENLMSECDTLDHLLAAGGIDYLHIRKETQDPKYITKIVNRIPKNYRDILVLHGYKEIVEHYRLGGLHHKSVSSFDKSFDSGFQTKAFHSIDELRNCKEKYNYGFLSPIFDSISKKDYKSSFDLDKLKTFLNSNEKPFPIIALGGINPENITICKELGFDGVAILGAIWQEIFLHKKLNVFEEIKSKL